jgi:hypothetical protein
MVSMVRLRQFIYRFYANAVHNSVQLLVSSASIVLRFLSSGKSGFDRLFVAHNFPTNINKTYFSKFRKI